MSDRPRIVRDDPLLTPKEVAVRLRISPSLVYEWLKEEPPRIKYRRFGQKGRRGVYRIAESDLSAFMEECAAELEED